MGAHANLRIVDCECLWWHPVVACQERWHILHMFVVYSRFVCDLIHEHLETAQKFLKNGKEVAGAADHIHLYGGGVPGLPCRTGRSG